MAKYNRDFLVPYLQDICALHLTDRKLQARRYELEERIGELEAKKYYYNPTPPKRRPVITFGVIILLLLGGFILLVGIGNLFIAIEQEITSMIICSFLIDAMGIGLIWFGYGVIDDHKEENKRIQKEYESKVQSDKREKEKYEQGLKRVPGLRTELQRCITEDRKVKMLLEKLYSANVIPRQYREVYAAVYLYDWFSTSGADDIEMALNMFVLEEIKARLDRIIENQSNIILNQRIMIANQQRAQEQQDRHNRMMHDKLNQLQVSSEERNRYLCMIENNTAVTAFFAQASYIRNLK